MQNLTLDEPKAPQQIKSLHTLILEKPPCCLEFCPEHRDYFVVGTYNLVKEDEAKKPDAIMNAEAVVDEDEAQVTEKKQQMRDGSLILCKIVDGNM
jgi:diphthamide biosynthesis protein 7